MSLLSRNSPWLVVFILFAVPLGPMATDVFTPSLPAIQTAFSATRASVQWSIPVFLLSYALGQIVYGSLSDSWGRRGLSCLGLLIFVGGCLVAIWAPSVEVLLAARFLQGLGISATSVLTKTMTGDCYEGDQLKQVSGWITLLWGFSPVVAPALGGYLQQYFGWQACFYLLLGYGLLSLAVFSLIMPETSSDKQSLDLRSLFRDQMNIVKHPPFLLNVVVFGCSYSVMQAFNIFAPFMVQDLLGYSPVFYGHLALVVGFSFLLGASVYKVCVKKIGAEKSYSVALWGHVFGSVLILILAELGFFDIWAIVGPTCIVVFFSSFISSHCMATGIAMFTRNTGTAVALMSFLLIFLSVIVTFSFSFIHVSSQKPLAVVFILLSLTALVASMLEKKRQEPAAV